MDLPSDSDESDVDFVPGAGESLSEAESDVDKETDAQYDKEVQIKKDKKRLSASSSRKKKSKRIKRLSDSKEESKPETEVDKDPVVQKKYEDDLWASFLDTPTPPKKAEKTEKELSNSKKSEKSNDIINDDRFGIAKTVTDIPVKKSNIFDNEELDAAGDIKSSAQSSTSKEKIVTPVIPPGIKPRNSSGGGLSSILSKIGKNNKVSTLEKSKLDWNSFKKDEDIEDEIGVHNRGRNGYLERQDFLERTDHRQFELEKNLRANKRTKR